MGPPPFGGGSLTETSAQIREQDLEDLNARWRESIEEMKRQPSEETSERVLEAFNAILEYMHAGEIPDATGMKDGLLYRVEETKRP